MDKNIASIVKALAYTENGGKLDLNKLQAGKSGEMKSIFQFKPSTWKLYAKQTSGNPELPPTPENESLVVYHKVGDWYNHLKSEGVSDDDIPLKIASMWNAGENNSDAYKNNWKGTNSYGVKYDTPAYAKKVANYTKEFNGGGNSNQIDTPNEAPVQNNAQTQTGNNAGLLASSARVSGLIPKI